MYVLPPPWNIKNGWVGLVKTVLNKSTNQPTDENYVCVVKRSCNKLQFPQIGTLKNETANKQVRERSAKMIMVLISVSKVLEYSERDKEREREKTHTIFFRPNVTCTQLINTHARKNIIMSFQMGVCATTRRKWIYR